MPLRKVRTKRKIRRNKRTKKRKCQRGRGRTIEEIMKRKIYESKFNGLHEKANKIHQTQETQITNHLLTRRFLAYELIKLEAQEKSLHHCSVLRGNTCSTNRKKQYNNIIKRLKEAKIRMRELNKSISQLSSQMTEDDNRLNERETKLHWKYRKTKQIPNKVYNRPQDLKIENVRKMKSNELGRNERKLLKKFPQKKSSSKKKSNSVDHSPDPR